MCDVRCAMCDVMCEVRECFSAKQTTMKCDRYKDIDRSTGLTHQISDNTTSIVQL
jgi:hypothetical protein